MIHLQTTIVKEDSISSQSSIDIFRYDWIHLPTTIVEEDNVIEIMHVVRGNHGLNHIDDLSYEESTMYREEG